MRFLGGKTRNDFEEMAKKNSELEEAYDVLDKLSADEKNRLEYETRQRAIRDYNIGMLTAERRGIEAGRKIGINKMAYAHNKDDFIETALMSLIYEGRFYAFPPVTELPEAGVTVIRPMMYVPERGVAHFVADQGIRVVKNTCPVDGSTKRAYAKQLMEQINRETPGAKERIMHAIVNGRFPDWPL